MPQDSPTLQTPPPVISGYELLRRIGAGSYGEVWFARGIMGYCAIKIIYRARFESDQPYEREFLGIKNFGLISRSHEGFMHILHVDRNEKDGYFYCVMELADDCERGQEIDPARYVPKTLSAARRIQGRIPVDEAVEAGLALTGALGKLHEHKLVHRDIKPSNIIFVHGKPKLADIGLVTMIGQASLVGSIDYMPPEGPGTASADLYSLGKVLYEVSTGKHPRSDFPELPSDLGESQDKVAFLRLNDVVTRACAVEVDGRYATAKEMHDAQLAVKEKRPPTPPPSRWPRLLAKASAALVALAAVVGIVTLLASKLDRSRLRLVGEIQVPDVASYSQALVGDWDGDGSHELILTDRNALIVVNTTGRILLNKLVSNWLVHLDLITDVNNDGKVEAFVSWREGTNLILSVLDQGGSPVKTFHATGGLYKGEPDSSIIALKVADLDRDGKRELIAKVGTAYGHKPRGLYCFNFEDGSLLWHYPTAPFITSVELVDLDKDGGLDVVFGSHSPGNGNQESDGTDDDHCYVYALSHTGQPLWRHELEGIFCNSSVIVSDLNNDGDAELLVRLERGPDHGPDFPEVGKLILFSLQGTPVTEHNLGATLWSAMVDDLDGDGTKEVITTDRRGFVTLLSPELLERRRKPIGTAEYGLSEAASVRIGDLDLDGRKEIVVAYSECERVSGNNPRGDRGTRNIRVYHNNAVLVISHDLNRIDRYLVAATWTKFPGFAVALDSDRNSSPACFSLADKALILRFRP